MSANIIPTVAKDVEEAVVWAEKNPQTVQYIDNAIAGRIPPQDRAYAEVIIGVATILLCVFEYKYGYTDMVWPIISLGAFFISAIMTAKKVLKGGKK